MSRKSIRSEQTLRTNEPTSTTIGEHMRILISLLMLALLTGCVRCGDGICLADVFREADFPSNRVAKVSINKEGALIFTPPHGLEANKYAILFVELLAETGEPVWKLISQNSIGLPLKDMAQFDNRNSILYGVTLSRTTVLIPPTELVNNTRYIFKVTPVNAAKADEVDFSYIKARFMLAKTDTGRVIDILPVP